MLDCAWKLSGLSISLMVRLPPVVSGALVSLSVTLAEDSTAASLLPVTVIVTSWVSTPPRPSLTCTLNTSL
ncbi:hypothetical protein D9M68_307890 [compost metagenome]